VDLNLKVGESYVRDVLRSVRREFDRPNGQNPLEKLALNVKTHLKERIKHPSSAKSGSVLSQTQTENTAPFMSTALEPFSAQAGSFESHESYIGLDPYVEKDSDSFGISTSSVVQARTEKDSGEFRALLGNNNRVKAHDT
jgi:hypothetical protein